MTSSLSSEKIIETFPHPTITPIVGQPNYESIAELHLKINTNAASVHSNRGNGYLGHLYLTIKPAACNALSATPFLPPLNPGPNPNIPTG